MSDQRFTKKERLRSEHEILAVRKEGRRQVVSPFVFFNRRNTLPTPRLALAFTRKSGDSVDRNRARRKFREFFRRHKKELGSFDYLITSSRDIRHLGEKDWERVFKIFSRMSHER